MEFSLADLCRCESYIERIRYCRTRLEKIDGGSGRLAYLLPDGDVLKLARNEKGTTQNEVERHLYATEGHRCPLLAQLKDSDPANHWIVMPRLSPITHADLEHCFSVSPGQWSLVISDFCEFANGSPLETLSHEFRGLYLTDSAFADLVDAGQHALRHQ